MIPELSVPLVREWVVFVVIDVLPKVHLHVQVSLINTTGSHFSHRSLPSVASQLQITLIG
jgi:hypothetical protein